MVVASNLSTHSRFAAGRKLHFRHGRRGFFLGRPPEHGDLGREITHDLHDLPRRAEDKFGPSFRDRQPEEFSKGKPLTAATEHEFIDVHPEVIRIVTLLEHDVRSAPIARRDFVGLPPRGQADQPDILEVVGDLAEIGIALLGDGG